MGYWEQKELERGSRTCPDCGSKNRKTNDYCHFCGDCGRTWFKKTISVDERYLRDLKHRISGFEKRGDIDSAKKLAQMLPINEYNKLCKRKGW